MLPFSSIANENSAEEKREAIEYIKNVISSEVHFNGSNSGSDGVIDLELSIDHEGEITVTGIDTEDLTLKEELKSQIEQIVFPGIKEVHGKVVICKLRLETI